MNLSSERKQKRPVSYADETCNERKCANCYENRGCMYDLYMSASLEEVESPQTPKLLPRKEDAIQPNITTP